MHALTERLNTPDKRIVAVVGALFATSFLLVNYGSLRKMAGACVEAGHYASTGVLFDARPVAGGTSVNVASAWLCPAHPPQSAELTLSFAAGLPGLLFSGTALALLCFFLWGAVRPGLHAPVTPGRLRGLGWFVLIGGPVADALHHFFTYELAERVLRATETFRQEPFPDPNADYSAWLQELQASFPWWCVFAGVSALIVARLLRTEVRMAQDLEGTI